MEHVIDRYRKLLQQLLATPPIALDDNLYSALPVQGGVYRVFQKGSDWHSSVYVGETGNLRERIYRNHLMGNLESSTLKRKLIKLGVCHDERDAKRYLRERCLVQLLTDDHFGDEARTSFEHFAVAILRPRIND
jgi:hypothetical protein